MRNERLEQIFDDHKIMPNAGRRCERNGTAVLAQGRVCHSKGVAVRPQSQWTSLDHLSDHRIKSTLLWANPKPVIIALH